MLQNDRYEYEFKLFLKEDEVIDTKNTLKEYVANIFNISNDKFKQMDIQFIDTEVQDFYKNGWILRNRKKEDKEGKIYYELTYKKRYLLYEGNIDTALKQATIDGFKDLSEKFTVEIDWGLITQTLSISYEENEPVTNSLNLNLPDIKQLSAMFLNNAPEIFLKWGETHVQNSKIYGPVIAKKYKGNWEDTNINIEIWTLDGYSESIVEISLEKSQDKNKSLQDYEKLKEFLLKKGWLCEEEISKTLWVLEHSK
ncbi:hypothetical protein [Bacillus thuringiensis]|uniref:hypothetical protein n=1 Tax=Bacillus thuringiensis TaxID=1428 RepID=UPI002D7E4244|nr:hypothetical protein [Bacillus thuringiensis]MEB4818364.1 hypothetical protein [Bacillus thuringiensis]